MTECVLHRAGHCCHGDSVTCGSLIWVYSAALFCVRLVCEQACSSLRLRKIFSGISHAGCVCAGVKRKEKQKERVIGHLCHIFLFMVRAFVSRLALPESY